MGLDMYLQGRKSYFNVGDKPVREEDGFQVDSMTLELGYWRKHPNLHGYIVQTFAEGVDECQEIELDADALRKIAGAIKADTLPHTKGFFFGDSQWHEDDKDKNAAVFEKAAAWMEAKSPKHPTVPDYRAEWSRTVFYRASW